MHFNKNKKYCISHLAYICILLLMLEIMITSKCRQTMYAHHGNCIRDSLTTVKTGFTTREIFLTRNMPAHYFCFFYLYSLCLVDATVNVCMCNVRRYKAHTTNTKLADKNKTCALCSLFSLYSTTQCHWPVMKFCCRLCLALNVFSFFWLNFF